MTVVDENVSDDTPSPILSPITNRIPNQITNPTRVVPSIQAGSSSSSGSADASRPQRLRRPNPRYDGYLLDLDDLSESDGESALLTFREVSKLEDRDEKEKWHEAIQHEKDSLDGHNVWSYVDKAEAAGHKIMTSKWVFRIKDSGMYKARLCIRGYEQTGEMDTFSPVVNMTALRVLFALAASKNYSIQTFDVKTAFLYGELKEPVFMHVPDGYSKPGKICKLNKSLYGLKNAPLTWHNTLTKTLKELGLEPLKADKCIFASVDKEVLLSVYVDDGCAIGPSGSNEKAKR